MSASFLEACAARLADATPSVEPPITEALYSAVFGEPNLLDEIASHLPFFEAYDARCVSRSFDDVLTSHLDQLRPRLLPLLEPPFRCSVEDVRSAVTVNFAQLWGRSLAWQTMSSFSYAVKAGALPCCEGLSLEQTEMNDYDVESLAEALAAGALARLEELSLFDNRIRDLGAAALARVCAGGALPRLRQLHLAQNDIGHEGLAALAAALAGGGLPSLDVLYVDDADAQNEDLVAACRARGIKLA